ncbi:Pentatricopeptide repeat-containing protein At4g21170 [Linum perenne]
MAISSANWRSQISQSQLLHQISTILLQRKNWQQLLLRNQNLTSNLSPSLFSQIIRRTRTNPEVSLDFFNWVKSNLSFEPDLNSQCQILTICISSSLPHRHVIPTLDSLIQTHTSSLIVETITKDCKGKSFESNVLSFVCEYFARRGQFKEGLTVFNRMKVSGLTPSVNACNAILDGLIRENENKLVWCFYGAMIRHCFKPDKLTWSLLAKVLAKGGSFERIVKVVDLGVSASSSAMCNALVDSYSKNGNFDAAFDRVKEMIEPGFGTYASILDGACRYRNDEVVERVVGIMLEKGLLIEKPMYDELIRKLCSLAKTNAISTFLNRARDEKVRLQDSTYSSALKTLSKEGRIDEAIRVYRLVLENGIKAVKNNAYEAFVNLLCEGGDEKYEPLKTVLQNGFKPCTSVMSRFISLECEKRRWKRAEEVLELVLENSLLPDSSCLCCLVHHYCSNKQIDKAISLHSKLEKFEGRLDVFTYNMILDGLVRERRGAEAVKMFDFMRGFGLVDSESFVTVIRVVLRDKEMRKAMQLHDEMLQMGLKPCEAVYKKLILGFQ